jgi:hypothetical protein
MSPDKSTQPFHFLLLTITVLVVFYPTIHAEVSLIDDFDMLNWLHQVDLNFTHVQHMLFPGGNHGGYYRPFVGISFLLDKYFLNANPLFMHLEGILFHLFNVFLVYLLSHECLKLFKNQYNYLIPFYSSLVWGLHPIATESVNWISGRTDIMMGNFILFGTILILRYKHTSKRGYLLSAIMMILLGCLAKEAAFGAFAGAILLVLTPATHLHCNASTVTAKNISTNSIVAFLIFYSISFLSALFYRNYWVVLVSFLGYWVFELWQTKKHDNKTWSDLLSPILFACLLFAMSIGVFFLLRRMAFVTDAGKIGSTIRLMFIDPGYSVSLFIGAIGFYVQKFFYPWPLNFFILEVDPLYDFVGIIIIFIIIKFLTRHTIVASLFIIGAGLVITVLPFAFGTIAWTSYAERYMYLPSAFWCVALGILFANLLHKKSLVLETKNNIWSLVLLYFVLIVFSITTWQRNVVWQKNVTLLGDTVKKSPKIKVLRNFYMAALFNAGQFSEAIEQYEIAKTLYSRTYDPAPDLLMAHIHQIKNNHNLAYQYYQNAITATGSNSLLPLQAMVAFLEKISLVDGPFVLSKPEIQQKIFIYRFTLKKLQEQASSSK